MVSSLPSRPNLLHLKHQAKQLLRAHRGGRSEDCAVLRNIRRFAELDDPGLLAAPLALHDVQYALALEYGFPSWKALRTHVTSGEDARAHSDAPSLVHRDSLWATTDAVSEAYFYGRSLTTEQRREAAEFIAARQGGRGAYLGMFVPTEKDAREGMRLFTGERVSGGAGNDHILGEEACRALLLLDHKAIEVRAALQRASQRVLGSLGECLARPTRPAGSLQPGMFCCMKCSCALWRHLAARKSDEYEQFLAAGVRAIRLSRDGKGGWKYWPFSYGLLTLSEIGTPLAIAEMRYAAKACEAELKKRFSSRNIYSLRRRHVYERVLAKC